MANLLFLFFIGWCSSAPLPSGKIELTIPNLKNGKGALLICLFSQKEGFPSDPKQSMRRWKVPVSQKVTLSNIPKGRYALSIVHDEDGNNAMTYNLVQMPKEGFAFSNHRPMLLQRPDFEKALFIHDQELTSLSLPLRY